LTSIELPSTLITIDIGAFIGCTGLTSVIIPENVTTIVGTAFGSCTNLEFLYLPSNIESIGHNAFTSTDNLTYIVCDSSEVAMLLIDSGVDAALVYTLQTEGYESLTFSDVEIGEVTIATATDWVRTGSDGLYKYYKKG